MFIMGTLPYRLGPTKNFKIFSHCFYAGQNQLWDFLPGCLHSELFSLKVYVPQTKLQKKKGIFGTKHFFLAYLVHFKTYLMQKHHV